MPGSAKWSDKPWERQKGEGEKAYEAFTVYRDMGEERTIAAVVKRLNKSRSLIDRWKVQWEWTERIRAYDNEIEKGKLAKKKKEREDMRTRHAKIANQLQTKALEALREMDSKVLEPKDIVRFLELSAKLEQAARLDQPQDRALEFEREQFEYQKERDAGEIAEYEDLDEVEEAIYGTDK